MRLNQLWVSDLTSVVKWRGYASVAFVIDVFSHRIVGVRTSRGTVGDAYDNAMAESFFATLECERLDRRTYRSHTEARLDLFQYIEGWYNPHRRHSGIGNQSPINFERATAQAA